METDNYSAEYGRSAGAVINVSIRSGTNKFHGKAYDYIRNTAFNAIGPVHPSIQPVDGQIAETDSVCATSLAAPSADPSGRITLTFSPTMKECVR